MRRGKTFLILVATHLGLTLGAVHLALFAFVAGLSGADAVLLDAAGRLAETAVWVLGSPVPTSAWAISPGYWDTPPVVALAAPTPAAARDRPLPTRLTPASDARHARHHPHHRRLVRWAP